MRVLIYMVVIFSSTWALGHAGNVDKHGCHYQAGIGRHCHGANAGKYIPDPEAKRLERLRRDNCNSIDADGQRVRFDVYGKPCRNRSK